MERGWSNVYYIENRTDFTGHSRDYTDYEDVKKQ